MSSPQDGQEKHANPVKAEEAKLKAKYPGLAQRPGGSDFLMKRLQKGVGELVTAVLKAAASSPSLIRAG